MRALMAALVAFSSRCPPGPRTRPGPGNGKPAGVSTGDNSLLVAHATTPDLLAAFTDKLVTATTVSSHVCPGSVSVGVTSIGPEEVDIELSCRLEVRNADDERADRTALMLDVLRLTDRMQVRLGDQDMIAKPPVATRLIAAPTMQTAAA